MSISPAGIINIVPTRRDADLPDRSRNRLKRVSRPRPYVCVYRYKDNRPTVYCSYLFYADRQLAELRNYIGLGVTETADLVLENILVFEDKISRAGSATQCLTVVSILCQQYYTHQSRKLFSVNQSRKLKHKPIILQCKLRLQRTGNRPWRNRDGDRGGLCTAVAPERI